MNSSSSTKVSISSQGPRHQYTIKVMDPGKKSDYDVKELQGCKKFTSIDEIKKTVSDVDSPVGDIGYISPWHGMKGKKHPLVDEDVVAMYNLYNSKCNVLLWCYVLSTGAAQSGSSGQKRKRGDDEADSAPRSKRVINEKKIQEIEDIITQLKEKHGSKYKVEHLNAWAHLIHLGKHSSLDTPPNYPYFVGRKCAKTPASKDIESHSDPATSSVKANPGTLSPGKRVHLRSECIDQLSRWHSLKESGGITLEEYDELRKNIIGDIGKF